MIFFVQGYLVKHLVSTDFMVVIAHLSLYSAILNLPVTVQIIIMDLTFKFYFFPFIRIMEGPIISTQSLLNGIYSDTLAGNLP